MPNNYINISDENDISISFDSSCAPVQSVRTKSYSEESIFDGAIAGLSSRGVDEPSVKRRKNDLYSATEDDFIKEAESLKDVESKKKFLTDVLEDNPHFPRLWAKLATLETDFKARRKIYHQAKAVCGVKQDLALAFVSLVMSYDCAKAVLLRKIETSFNLTCKKVSLTLAKLEESNNCGSDIIRGIINKTLIWLADDGAEYDKNEWINEAIKAEQSGHIICCTEIINSIIGLKNDDENQKIALMKDIDACRRKGALECVRTIYSESMQAYPSKIAIPLCAIFKEEAFKKPEDLKRLLKLTEKDEIIWLISAKISWMTGEFDSAQLFFAMAFHANPECKIILMKPNLHCMLDQCAVLDNDINAIDLLREAAKTEITSSVVLKLIKLERANGKIFNHMSLLDAAERFKNNAELWIVKGEIEAEKNQLEKAAQTFKSGIKYNPKSLELWLLLAELEKNRGQIVKARCILDQGRVENPQNDQLWIAAIHFEIYVGNKEMAKFLIARALQKCPKSGELIAEDIFLEESPLNKSKLTLALESKVFHDDPYVLLTAAKLSWIERNIPKCREFLNKTVETNPQFGDAWGYFIKFELRYGTHQQKKEALSRYISSDMPKQGREWCKVSENYANLRLTAVDLLGKVVKSFPIPQRIR